MTEEEDRLRRSVTERDAAEAELLAAVRSAYDAGMTQRAIADILGVSQGKIWRMLNPSYVTSWH